MRSSLWFTTDPVWRNLFRNAYHHGFWPQQFEVFWSRLLQADSEEPYSHLLCSILAHYLQHIIIFESLKNLWYSFSICKITNLDVLINHNLTGWNQYIKESSTYISLFSDILREFQGQQLSYRWEITLCSSGEKTHFHGYLRDALSLKRLWIKTGMNI